MDNNKTARRRRRRNVKKRTTENNKEDQKTNQKIREKPGRHMKILDNKDYLRYQNYTHKEICKIKLVL